MRGLSGTGTEESNPASGLSGLVARFSDDAVDVDDAAALVSVKLMLAVGGGDVSCTPIPVRGGNKGI